jgi:hypothetical protein
MPGFGLVGTIVELVVRLVQYERVRICDAFRDSAVRKVAVAAVRPLIKVSL